MTATSATKAAPVPLTYHLHQHPPLSPSTTPTSQAAAMVAIAASATSGADLEASGVVGGFPAIAAKLDPLHAPRGGCFSVEQRKRGVLMTMQVEARNSSTIEKGPRESAATGGDVLLLLEADAMNGEAVRDGQCKAVCETTTNIVNHDDDDNDVAPLRIAFHDDGNTQQQQQHQATAATNNRGDNTEAGKEKRENSLCCGSSPSNLPMASSSYMQTTPCPPPASQHTIVDNHESKAPSSAMRIEHKPKAHTALPIKSCLKKSSLRNAANDSTSALVANNNKTTKKPNTARRVSGLWGVPVATTITQQRQTPSFPQLSEKLVSNILTFLPMLDQFRFSGSSARHFAIVHQAKDHWGHVDATSTVHQLHAHYKSKSDAADALAADAHTTATGLPPKPTTVTTTMKRSKSFNAVDPIAEKVGKHLDRLLAPHQSHIQSLTIRNIQHRLSAHSWLPPSQLRSLTLTHFEDLTDTHLHVFCLSGGSGTANSGKHILRSRPLPLQQLTLQYCPLVSSVASIAKFCPELNSLDVQGCSKITDISSLTSLFVAAKKSPSAAATSAPLSTSTRGLGSLFGAPQSASASTRGLGSLFGERAAPAPAPPASRGLGSLFAAPQPAPSQLGSLFATPKPVAPQPPKTAPSLSSMFQRPAPSQPKQHLASLFANDSSSPPQPQPTGSPPKSSLECLFAPPGMSPKRNEHAQSIHGSSSANKHATTLYRRGSSSIQEQQQSIKLHLNIMETGVNPL